MEGELPPALRGQGFYSFHAPPTCNKGLPEIGKPRYKSARPNRTGYFPSKGEGGRATAGRGRIRMPPRSTRRLHVVDVGRAGNSLQALRDFARVSRRLPAALLHHGAPTLSPRGARSSIPRGERSRSFSGCQVAGVATCRTCASAAWFTGARGRPWPPRACGSARTIAAVRANTARRRLLAAARLCSLLAVHVVGASVGPAPTPFLPFLFPPLS